MTRIPAQELQYARHALEHERAMCEVLQAIDPEKFANRRELMTDAGRLREQYSVHAICDALNIHRGTFYNHIFRAKGELSEYVLRDNCHSVGELYVAYYNTKRPHQTLGFLMPDAKGSAYEAGGSEV